MEYRGAAPSWSFPPGYEVYFFYVDDAVRIFSSREHMTRKNRVWVADVAEVAHLAEAAGVGDAVVIVAAAAQYICGVDAAYRAMSDLYIVKSPSIIEDQEFWRHIDIDEDELRAWAAGITRRETWALSRCLVIGDFGAAWYHFHPAYPVITPPTPSTPTSTPTTSTSTSEAPSFTTTRIKTTTSEPWSTFETIEKNILTELETTQKWTREAKAYIACRLSGATTRAYAESLGIPQGTVATWLSKITGEVIRRLAPTAENWVAKELEREGWRVTRMGGQGEPDLIAYSPDSIKKVVAVKLFHDPKGTVSLPRSVFHAEDTYSQTHNCPIEIWFLNRAWREIHIFFMPPGKTVTIRRGDPSTLHHPSTRKHPP